MGKEVFVLVGYPVSVVICWKLYNYFNMTLLDAATTTGFNYHLKKICFSLFVPLIVILFGLPASDKTKSSTNEMSKQSTGPNNALQVQGGVKESPVLPLNTQETNTPNPAEIPQLEATQKNSEPLTKSPAASTNTEN